MTLVKNDVLLYERAFIKPFSKSGDIYRMPGSNPTIYDVASAAGVSISTVSRVLNTHKAVNDATRARVLSAIESLGYFPKAEARVRALKETRRIGVITPSFTAPSFVQRLRGIASALAPNNYELVIYTVDSTERVREYLETLPFLSHHLDGLILISLDFKDDLAAKLIKFGLETVLIEYPQRLLSSVEIDDISGGRMGTEYLIKKGYRNIAFTGDFALPEYGVRSIANRLAGFKIAMAEAGIQTPDEYIRPIPFDIESTRQQIRDLLSMTKRPDAIFAATDIQAMGVLKAARDKGMKVPDDLAVIGFDDLDMADYIDLTTIRQHLDESGRIAVELLLSRLADSRRPVQHVHLPLEIVERLTA